MVSSELKTYYARERKAWRKWLEKNHAESPGIWLIYYKKTAGKSRLPYEDAVEEALCFGWIDSTVRKLDEERYIQRFTPRKPKSIWSKLNKQRVEKMMAAGLMTKAGIALVEKAKSDGSWDIMNKIDQLLVPQELEKAFAKNKKAKINFENFSVSVRRMFLHWVNSAKLPVTRKARIKQTVLMSAAGKKPTIKGFK